MSPNRTGSRYVWMIASIAALGGLLFGYDWVVIGGAKPFYEAFFGLTTPAQEGWAMSCALIGCFVGALTSGVLSEALGRKRSLQIAAATFLISACGTAIAWSFTAFVLWRITGGLAIGLASSLSPMYIAEISPASMRGKLVCLNELTIVLGLLTAQTMNWLIARPVAADTTPAEIVASWNGQAGWRWMFGVTAVPAAVFLLGMIVVPESPRWLALRGRTREATSILTRIGGASNAALVMVEIESTSHSNGLASEWSDLTQPRLRRVLLLGISLAVLQQWCGINVIFNYAQDVFAAAGYSLSSMLFNIVVTGITMVIFTFIAIATVDGKGRRFLMLGGCAGLTTIYTLLGYLYSIHSHGIQMLVLVVAAIACYAMTLAPITWVILSEIFPGYVRGGAMALATMSLWVACFVLTYSFPLLNRALGTANTFWIYAIVCAVGFFLVLRWLPETKGKTLEQIEASWK